MWLFFRWPTSDALVVNITAHPTQQSLIHLAGLTAAPKTVKTMALNGSLKKLQPVDSTDALFSDGEGYIQQWSGG